MMQFERYQSLIVIHADYRIIFTARGFVKKTIGWKRTIGWNSLSFCRLNSGYDNFFFFASENTFFTTVRVQCRHRDAGMRDSERILQSPVGEFQGRSNAVSRQAAHDFHITDMPGYQDDSQIFADEHHATLGRTAEFGEELGMA